MSEMNANNHYDRAVRLLKEAEECESGEVATAVLLTAQVHATLALRVDK